MFYFIANYKDFLCKDTSNCKAILILKGGFFRSCNNKSPLYLGLLCSFLSALAEGLEENQ